MEIDNEYEIACKEFLKGCTCSEADKQEDCKGCLTGFCNKIRSIAKKECYPQMNIYCLKD